ncbi:hypothetical protein [Ferruginibacter sp. SUN106]|uniref:hypothetical protein n=1 Tax=Ferruginibacter sp. SUN106 TaxID=2978348 RepID=UPI003D36D9FA
MRKFFLAAFKITLFQVFLIVFFSTLKYILTSYKLTDKIQQPFIWICFGAGIVFVLAIGITGIIEDRFGSYEEWLVKPQKNATERLLAIFSSWGTAIPVALAYVLLLYIFIPTTLSMFIALYAGIVIRNSIHFFAKANIHN